MLRPRDFFVMLLLFAAVLGALLIPRRPRTPTDSLSATAGIENADPDSDITGVVIDTRGRPVAGARITTDYRIWGRARIPGPDWLRAEVEGPETLTARDGTFLLDVGHGEIVDLCIRPQELGEAKACWRRPGDHLRIVVTDGADLTVHVTDEAGGPIADARVFVLGVLPYRAPMHYHSGVTNREGIYRYAALSRGTLEIRVLAESRAMEEPLRLTIPQRGAVAGSVRMVAAPDGASEPTGGMFSKIRTYSRGNRVRDENDRPIERARVVYGDRRVYTDGQGLLDFASHPPHPAGFAVWIPGRGRIVVGPSPVHLGGTLRLLPGRTVSGRVRKDLTGAVVELGRGPMTEEIAVVDARGTFRFADVARGTWTLTLLHPDVDSISREFRVEPDRDPEPLDLSR